MACARASGSLGGTSIPVSPSTTTSCSPPTRLATTGFPAVAASAATWPQGSSHTEGTTPTVQWAHAAMT